MRTSNRFCFRAGGRYFTGLRSVTTPRKELERQMDNHYRNITFKGDILKKNRWSSLTTHGMPL